MGTNLDALRDLDFGLTYLPHTVRDIIKSQPLIKWRLWDHITLITWCHNYRPTRVHNSMKRTAKAENTTDARTVLLALAKYEHRSFGKAFVHPIAFTAETARILFTIDREMLYGDYSDIRWQHALDLFGQLTEEDVALVAGESGRCNMHIALLKLESYVQAMVRTMQEWQELQASPLSQTPSLSAESQERLARTVRHLAHLQRLRKNKDGTDSTTK